METFRGPVAVPGYYSDQLLVFQEELQALVMFKYQAISVHICQPYFKRACSKWMLSAIVKMESLFLEACIQVDSEKQQVLTTTRKENGNVTVYPYVCLGQLFCFKANDWLPRGGKSSRLSCCSLAGIPRIQLSAPDSCFYSWVTVIVLTLVTVTKNGHLTHFFWRIHLNTGVRLTSYPCGETKRIEQISLLKNSTATIISNI